ncbi:secretin N-terminal domain-containing protein [Francisellaceae bacterium]|nr:secretin N-terminal domain-containing protein [Francisellaceae bacterium]
MRLLSKLIVCISLNIFLVGCSAVKGDPAINQIDSAVDNGIKGNKKLKTQHQLAVSDLLLPSLSLPNENAANNQRFDVAVNNMSAKTFFSGLVSDTPYSIVVSPNVDQSISLSLKNVTIPEVLATTASLYDLEFKKTQYGYEVYPAGIETRIFKINYLDIVRKGESRTMVNSGSLSANNQNGGIGNGNTQFGGGAFGGGFGGFGGNNGGFAGNGTGNNNNNLGAGAANGLQLSTSVISQSESNFWEELEDSLDLFIGEVDSKDVVINPQSGTVVVRTTKQKANQIAEYIDGLQSTMNRQVILEAKIMEVTLSDGYQAGIDWNIFGAKQELNQAFGGGETLIDSAKELLNVFSVKATWGGDKFTTFIRLLSTQGNVQVLSSPRIATMNNQKAIMKIGEDSFFITGVDNTIVGDVGANNVQSVNLQPFFSGLALSVTPQIAPDNDIILHIHPIISDVSQKILKYKLGGDQNEQQIPTASSKIKESDNIVRAENGQMVVIAGLMGSSTEETIDSVPFLGKIPYFGSFFRSTKQESVRTEMVILLRPVIIINGQEWTRDMEAMKERYKKLNRGFHFGSHMQRFGTEGEFEYTE